LFHATNFAGAVYDWMLDSVVIPGWKFSDLGAINPGTYMVKVTSALSPCPAYSNQVKLIANDPGYTLTITKPTDSIICAGSAITLTAVPSKSGITYQWSKNNVVIPSATSSTYVVTTTGYYRATIFDGVSSCPAVSRNILITVKPNPPAIITVPGGTTTACENIGVRLNANTGGYKYEWTRGGSTIFGWVDSTQTVKNSGIYRVKVRTPDGCVSVSAPITVNILPAPTPTITKSGLVLSATATYVAYTWVRNAGEIVGSSATFTVSKNGVYKLRVRDANGCEGESNPIEINENGLGVGALVVEASQIKIYPNPSDGKVFIESPIELNIEVKDVTGKTVLQAAEVKEIDLSKYADGIYLFVIRDKDQLIKQQRVTKTSK
jgi:glucuronoarabinoxylan endo-1,4-beta-xylanase